MKRLNWAVITLVAVLATSLSGSNAYAAKYVFYHLLWGMTDPTVQQHIKSGEAYMASHPDVEIKYVGPENYDPAGHAKFLDTIVNAHPDGIALHISNVDALLPGLKRAKELGIPVVSVTSHPPGAKDNEKLKGLYLTWVGADEEKVGAVMAEGLLKDVKPVHVAYLLAHLGHAGQEQRAAGFFAAMPQGVKTDKVAVGDEPSHAKDVIRSFLTANPDVNVLFGSAIMNKWVADVIDGLGRTYIAVLTSDESPTSLECVALGKCYATFSQEFPIQAPLAYEILYNYVRTKMAPLAPIITGPVIVDKHNVQQFKDVVLSIFGQKTYEKLSPF